MIITTACGLDCYDACKIVVKDGAFPDISGDVEHPAGNGALCTLLNKSIHEESRIENARVNGEEVSLDEAMEAVCDAFKKTSSLLWRGSGNMGVMQEVTNLFMEKIEGTLTHGSLCDGAGDAGIMEGRGVNKGLPIEQIKKADTIVIWGRNVTVTNAHMMPFLKGKKIVVIDPVKTAIAKKADHHLQLQPRTDHEVALILAKFILMKKRKDAQWLEGSLPVDEDFYDFVREAHLERVLEHCGTDVVEMSRLLHYLRHPKVVFLVGTGVQKYVHGAAVVHAIDTLAETLGLFGKEGCGVHYLSHSKLGFINPFAVRCKSVSKVVTNFSAFDTVLVQGGNPAESMPDSKRVCEELEKVDNLIYFGLYENETSRRADIVIPAKTFFEKEDVRLSYGHQYVQKMNKVTDAGIGISEYDFTQRLFDTFGFSGLKSETHYIDTWLTQCQMQDGHYISPAYEALPYEKGFGEEGNEAFHFSEDDRDGLMYAGLFTNVGTLKNDQAEDGRFWLLTPKANKALNTQFKRDRKVQIHPESGYKEGEKVLLRSAFGTLALEVVLNEDVRRDCVVVTNNTLGLNILTPGLISEKGENACYQEAKITIEKV